MFVGNNLAALAAKAATTTVPIVFASGSDPVMDGLVASLNRPGGNVTGVSFTSGVLGPKRLELLRQLVPGAKTIAMLANQSTAETVTERSDVQAAALAIGQQTRGSRCQQRPRHRGGLCNIHPARGRSAAGRYGRVLELPSGTDRCAGDAPGAAGGLSSARVRRGRWPDELWNQHKRCLSPGRRLRRADSQRREAGRPAGSCSPSNSS